MVAAGIELKRLGRSGVSSQDFVYTLDGHATLAHGGGAAFWAFLFLEKK